MDTKIITYTGRTFDLLDPHPEMVCVEDIAHALANMCRYTGHVQEFYSVAQHSVLIANIDSPCSQLQRLLHDAAEAYTGDLASPWKQFLHVNISKNEIINECCVPVREWEEKIQMVIGLALEINLSHSVEIKELDNRMYLTEIRDLMAPSAEFKKCGYLEPFQTKITCWSPATAKNLFLTTYRSLKGLI